MSRERWSLVFALSLCSSCASERVSTPSDEPPAIAKALQGMALTVGSAVDLDVRSAFTDKKGRGLSFAAEFTPNGLGLSLIEGRIVGTPSAPGVVWARVIATDAGGDTVSQSLPLVAFAAELTVPVLPTQPFSYTDARVVLPAHYGLANAPGGSALAMSNVPATNPTTDVGAALGRVLFYDKRLSANDRVACASCHVQELGFSDTAQFSAGFAGGRTGRHTSAIANARFYQRGRFFWDERAATLEAQVLQPIQNDVEMGLTLDRLALKLQLTPYYAPLFQAAFGSTAITADRVSLALAQYVRSIVSSGSRFDSAFAPGAVAPDLARLTPQEGQGLALFNGQGRCAQCHATNAHISDNVHNTGLDATVTDVGAGNGAFKSPSLRNVAVRGRFMHDGRFTSLAQVVAFYNDGIQPNPFLDNRLRGGNGAPIRLGLSPAQRDAIVAYLMTLTDRPLLSDPRFASPFPK